MTRYEKYQRMTIDEAAELISGMTAEGRESLKEFVQNIDIDRWCKEKYCALWESNEDGECDFKHCHAAAVNWLNEETGE